MSKNWYLSKTLWLQILGIVALIVPATAAFIGEYFAEAGIGWALINMILRLLTKDKIEIKSNVQSFVLGFIFLASFSACSLLDKGEDTETPPVDKCNQAKVCEQFTEANKPALVEKYGHSCKVGDWIGTGDKVCSSTEAKCKCK